MKSLNGIAYVLVIIGALDWGLTGLGNLAGSNWNVINLILGSVPSIEAIVYILVGISALVLLFGKKSSMGGMAM